MYDSLDDAATHLLQKYTIKLTGTCLLFLPSYISASTKKTKTKPNSVS